MQVKELHSSRRQEGKPSLTLQGSRHVKSQTQTQIIFFKYLLISDRNILLLGPEQVSRERRSLKWLEGNIPEIKLGGFYAPKHCRSMYKIAILVPYK